nr:ribonuclease H-like domain-containing protein [Sedimentibacter sp.]
MIVNSNETSITTNIELSELMKQSVFLDIETTGLSRQFSDIISITILLHEDNVYKIHQIFCQYSVDEPQALKLLKDLIKNKKFIITYNGNSFDIPFLSFKAQKHGIDLKLENMIKIDLYNYLRHVKNKIEIPGLKLKAVEEYFKINRTDTLSGEDVTVLYEAYRLEPRKEFSFLIMQHNYEDVLNLPVLMNSIFSLYDDVLYFNNLVVKVNTNDYCIKKNSLAGKFNIISDLKADYIHSSINFNLNMNISSQTMDLDIPVGFFKDSSISEFYFVDNKEYNLKSYTAIEGIKRNLIPIKLNGKMYYTNILGLTKSILHSIFTPT